MKRSEAIDHAIELGKQDRTNNLPITARYADDTLQDAYLRGYDPDGTIVPFKSGSKYTLKNIAEYSILSRNHGTGKVIVYDWTNKLIEKVTKAYSLGTRNEVERMLLDGNAVNCPNATFTLVRKDSIRHCVRCDNAFVYSDTMPDRIYCSETCWQYEKSIGIQRDIEGNIIAGRMRHNIDWSIPQTIERSDPKAFPTILNCLIYQDDSCRIYAYRNPEQESAIVDYESNHSIQYVAAYNERHAAYLIVRW